MPSQAQCPACQRPVTPGDAVCFHCRAVLDPFTSGARVADRYVIEESIGQGGMGRVYRAYDEALQEKVAIKTLLPEFSTNPGFLSRFRDEVRLARRVAHPNVCRVHDYVDHGGTPFLSMEWVDGETLAARLLRLGPRPDAELEAVRSDVTQALRALWSNGIVHRDLKPANLMWTSSGRVKVMDLGLARSLLREGDRDRTSGVLGSPEYLSPEQIRGESATEKSDTYALGVTLFELATGHPPFRGDTPAQTLMKHLSEVPDSAALATLSEGLRSTVLRSLEKNPAARPDLRGSASDRNLVDPESMPVRDGPKPARKIAWAASATGLGSVIAAAVYFGDGLRSVPGRALSARPASPPFASKSPTTTREVPAESAPAATGPVAPTPVLQPDRSIRATPEPPPVSISGAPTPERTTTPSSPEAAPTPAPSATLAPAPALRAGTPTPTEPAPHPTLTPAPPAPVEARLVVVATPWAEVFVDGDRKGLTPLSPLVLPPGSHVLELRHPDYRPYLRTVDLKAGEPLRISVNLRLEAIRR